MFFMIGMFDMRIFKFIMSDVQHNSVVGEYVQIPALTYMDTVVIY